MKEIINIPLEIPKALIDAGAIELYARKFMNWTPTIIEAREEQVEVIPATDESEAIFETRRIETEVENPVTAFDACVSHIRKFVKDGYRTILAEQGAEQGRKQAIESFEQLFNE